MRESNSHQRFWRPLSYHLTNPLSKPTCKISFTVAIIHIKATIVKLIVYFYYKEFYKEIDVVDKEELLDYCLTERRRELCGETNHRWCDLRRYGKTVKHVLVESELQEFEQNMSLFALPIPEDVLKQNPNLKQN